MTDDLISFATSTVVIPFALLVCHAYRRSAWSIWRGEPSAVDWFGHGVFAGFLALGLNTFWWGFMLRGADLFEFDDIHLWLRAFGGYADAIVKGAGGWAAWCHLKSLHLRIPAEERGRWTPLSVAFYPNLGNLIARTLNIVIRPK